MHHNHRCRQTGEDHIENKNLVTYALAIVSTNVDRQVVAIFGELFKKFTSNKTHINFGNKLRNVFGCHIN